jgi:hypothetical protein
VQGLGSDDYPPFFLTTPLRSKVSEVRYATCWVSRMVNRGLGFGVSIDGGAAWLLGGCAPLAFGVRQRAQGS